MASTLADILVTLSLETSKFSRQLKETGQELNNFKNHVNQVTNNMQSGFSSSMDKMADSMSEINQASQNSANVINSTTTAMGGSYNRLSIKSRTLARTLGTDMESMKSVLRAGTTEFEEFGTAGRWVSQEIREKFSGLPNHLQRYVQRLHEAGISTEGFADLNSKYSAVLIENARKTNDYIMNKTTQSARLMKSFAEDTNLSPLTNQFIALGDQMERSAVRGRPLAIALERIKPNASMKELKDELKFIEQGLQRARGAFIGFGVGALVGIAGMIYLAATLDERVAPAFENFKATWVDAFRPWITAIATSVVAVLDLFSAINQLIGQFSEAHPVLFKMIGAILLLTMVFGALLSPLAVTGIWTQGVRASFYALFMIIKPFVLGMLAVVGVALAVATAIAVLWVSIKELWANSEAFRQAWINIWNSVKEMVLNQFVTPVLGAWDRLKLAFSGLIATVTGGAGTMSNLWTFLGDRIAIVVNAIAGVVLPFMQSAFQILGMIVVGVIDGIIAVMNWLGEMWTIHGATITSVASQIWAKVQEAFSAISSYIMSIMPQVRQIIGDTFEFIRTLIDFVMTYIAPVVVKGFQIIWSIIQKLMPFVLSIIKDTWNNVKAIISSTVNIIQNVIQLFTNILKGNWKGAWENVKAILKNAVTLIWNLIQVWFLGKIIKIFGSFIKAGTGIIKSGWNGFLNIIKSALSGIRSFVSSVWSAISNTIRNFITKIVSTGKSKFNALKSAVVTAFNGVKSKATSIWNGIRDAITKPINKAKDTALDVVKKIVKAFKGMKIKIPKIKLPKIEISKGSKNIAGVDIPFPKFKVNWNAKGNIFNGASVLGGGQGVGEAGAEAVLPIQHKRYMKPFASSVASHLSNMTGGNDSKSTGGNQYVIEFNEPVVIREDADIQRIVDELERRRKISERASGVFSY